MKTALFINPPSGLYRRDDRCQSRVEDQTVRVIFEPIELAVYAAIFERAGWRCAIRDHPARGGKWRDVERDLRHLRHSPDVLVEGRDLVLADDAHERAVAAAQVHLCRRGDVAERVEEVAERRVGVHPVRA